MSAKTPHLTRRHALGAGAAVLAAPLVVTKARAAAEVSWKVQSHWPKASASYGDSLQIMCSAGVVAKCMRWGYSPYGDHDQAGDRFNACLRMARADYCGDGVATTRDGTSINVFDTLGIQTRDVAPPLWSRVAVRA